VPSFRYRALTASGELTSGTISAASVAEVAARLEARGLFYVDDGAAARAKTSGSLLGFLNRPSGEDVTVFTRDLALLLKAGARINDALDLLSGDIDLGRLRSVVANLRDGVLAGESFAEALARHPTLFPPIYVALVRVGEASGTLDQMLDVLATERIRAEALRRRLTDALRYPAFVLFAATGVLAFFLFFVLPNFASVLRDLAPSSIPSWWRFSACPISPPRTPPRSRSARSSSSRQAGSPCGARACTPPCSTASPGCRSRARS
jgi:general secretion pathway protein F